MCLKFHIVNFRFTFFYVLINWLRENPSITITGNVHNSSRETHLLAEKMWGSLTQLPYAFHRTYDLHKSTKARKSSGNRHSKRDNHIMYYIIFVFSLLISQINILFILKDRQKNCGMCVLVWLHEYACVRTCIIFYWTVIKYKFYAGSTSSGNTPTRTNSRQRRWYKVN